MKRLSFTAKVTALALLLAAVLSLTVATLPRMTTSEEPTVRAGREFTFFFTNKTGLTACGLQVEFSGVPINVINFVEELRPFKRVTPIEHTNSVYFYDGCVQPNEQASIKLSEAFGLEIKRYSWTKKDNKSIKDTLIPGSFNGVKQRIVTVEEREILPPPEEKIEFTPPLNLITFEVKAPPQGRIMVAQGDTVMENSLLAIKDQMRRDQILDQLARAGKPWLGILDNTKKLEEELAQLEIRSLIAGIVQELQVEMGKETAKVTLKIQQISYESPGR